VHQRIRGVIAALAVLVALTVTAVPSSPANAGVLPHDYNGPVLNGYLTYDGTTLTATASTVSWNQGTINIEADLYAGSTLEWEGRNTCNNSTWCSLPSAFKLCPQHGIVWQLYAYAWGPDTAGHTSVSDFKQIVS
jgi:hypothetical protein